MNSNSQTTSNWQACQSLLDYQFKNTELLLEALTHSSAKSQASKSYQRLEFLGDSILRFLISKYLYSRNSDADEGVLTKSISHLVSATTLSKIIKKLGLFPFIIQSITKKEEEFPDSILGDIFESILAAIYLDGGLKKAEAFTLKHFKPYFFLDADNHQNFKGILAEYIQKHHKGLPEYTLLETIGPAHTPSFKMQIKINNKIYGPISGNTKKNTEQALAELALKDLGLL